MQQQQDFLEMKQSVNSMNVELQTMRVAVQSANELLDVNRRSGNSKRELARLVLKCSSTSTQKISITMLFMSFLATIVAGISTTGTR